MRFEDLREFVALTHCKSFTQAAKKLYMSQSTLSSHIIRMEKELGFSLVDRSQERFALTPIGREFVLCAQDALFVYESGVDRCRELVEKAPLRMLVKHHIDEENRRPLVEAGNTISIVKSDASVDWVEELRRGVGDCICVPYSPNDEAFLSMMDTVGVRLRVFREERACICVSASNSLWALDALRAQDVQHARFTVFDDGYVQSWQQVVRDMLHLKADTQLRQKPIGSYDNLLLNLRSDEAFVMGTETVKEYIGWASGAIKVFTEVDGHPLSFKIAYAYLKDHPRAKEIEAFFAHAYGDMSHSETES